MVTELVLKLSFVRVKYTVTYECLVLQVRTSFGVEVRAHVIRIVL